MEENTLKHAYGQDIYSKQFSKHNNKSKEKQPESRSGKFS